MAKYFMHDYPDGPFRFFSTSHLTALLIIIAINIILVLMMKRFGTRSREKIIGYILASILILQELSLNIWRLYTGHWAMGTSLPLHLCGAAVVLSAIMLVTKSYQLYEIVYFWGLGGAIQALLTPDIGPYAFPHYRFFHFFVSHGSIVTASIFATFIYGFRPQSRSIRKVFLITNIYMVFIAGFNYLFDGNYLFICRKPDTASLLDFMGPWPWYIISLEIVGLISFYVYYSPFFIKDYFKRRVSAVEMSD